MKEEYYKKIPKIDLHCHLDGSVRTQTILELAQKQNYKLPADNVEELRKYVRVPLDCKSLSEFLERFEIFYPLLKNPYAMERTAYELCRDCSKENVKYLEIRFAPVLQKTEDFPVPAVVEAVLKGVKRAEGEFPIKCGVILCLYRGTTDRDSAQTVLAALKYSDSGVCGIDVAGDESRYPLEDFRKHIEKCRENNLGITIHAGEAGGPENILDALEMGADRIGHGVSLIKDPLLMERISDMGVPLEICLTSNVHTQVVSGYEDHPFMKFLENGVNITLNTDDRGVSGIDLTYEYMKAVGAGLTHEALSGIILNGAKFAFVPDEFRKSLIEDIEKGLITEREDYE